MDDIRITPKELREIMAEYQFDSSIFCDDDTKVYLAKEALSQIPEADRIIFCLALDKGSSRKVGKLLGCSHSTVLKTTKRIQQNLLEIITNLKEKEDGRI